MAYNTGNAPGSTHPKDLIDNAEDLDFLMTGGPGSVNNRLGVPLKSMQGLQQEFNADQITRANTFIATQNANQAAFDTAQLARENEYATSISSGIYPTTGLGLASTVFDQYFSVPSPDASEYLILYKNNAGTAEAVKRYPSAIAVDQVRITSGGLVPTVGGQALNGATAVTENGSYVGFAIPVGATGASSYVDFNFPISLPLLTQLVGSEVELIAQYEVTAGFLATYPITPKVRVGRGGSYVDVTPASSTLEQVGTAIIWRMKYTITAADLYLRAVYQVAAGHAAASVAASIKVKLVSYSVSKLASESLTPNDFMLDRRLDPLSAAIVAAQAGIADAKITSGELAPTTLNTASLANGAQSILSGGVTVGMLIPSGVTGINSFVVSTVPISSGALAKFVGATIRFTVSYDVSANFLAETPRTSVSLQVVRAGSTVNVTPASITTTQVGTVLTTVLTYVVTAADTLIKPLYQVSPASIAQSHDRTITLKSLTYVIASLAAGATGTSEDLILGIQLQALRDSIPVAGPITQIKVGPTGAYATPKLAMAAISDATVLKQYELLIDTSVIYDQDSNWMVKDYVHMSADGPGYARIHYENPDNVDPALIPATQTFWMNTTSTLTRLKVTGRNVRYPIHSDSSGGLKGRTQQFKQCWIEHLGNAGAQAYQNSISSGVTVWSSLHAFGCGTSSAMVIDAEGTVFRSPSSSFYFHTRELFAKGSQQTLRNCRMLVTEDDGTAVSVQPLGSMQEDGLQLFGCELGGFVSYQAIPWIPVTLENQPANHSEIRITGYGNSPAAFKITEFGRALKIESNDVTAASKVEVSGSAVATLFGRQVYSMPGSGGIKGYVYGWADISGAGVGAAFNVFITSLGQRLGDCTTVNKTLSVSVNGGSAIVITFNQNYTAQSNATILAAINAALGAAAVASAYNVGARYRPEMTDEERSLRNNSADGIYMGMLLAYDGHNKKVRKMTAADASSLFAGVALEDIYPGQWGRVKTSGWLLSTDLFEFTGTPTWHQAFYVDSATPGKPTLAVGSNAIMRGKASNVVEIAPK